MLEINNIFICDDISSAQFGKVNIIGLNAGSILALVTTPYNLTAHIVLGGKTNEKIINLGLKIIIKDTKNNIVIDNFIDLPKSDSQKRCLTPLFIVQPVKLLISSYGTLTISVYKQQKEIYKQDYQIVKGDSPLLKNPQLLSQSILFPGDSPTDLGLIINLFGHAVSSLKIFDSYVDPECLMLLLQKVNPQLKIEVLTLQKNKKLFIPNNPFNKKFLDATVKFSPRFHDRFININNTEYYHFGHSLKDIAGGRISRCSKIINKKEIEYFDKLYSDAWQDAVEWVL